MMRHLWAGLQVTVSALLLTHGSVAQNLSDAPTTIRVDVERQRIASQRARVEAVFIEAEQACYARFAVTDCLRKARTERRLTLGELRRQELVLNDMDRQAKALAALNRIQNNVSSKQPEPVEVQIEKTPEAP